MLTPKVSHDQFLVKWIYFNNNSRYVNHKKYNKIVMSVILGLLRFFVKKFWSKRLGENRYQRCIDKKLVMRQPEG